MCIHSNETDIKRLKIQKGNVYSTFWIHGLYAFFTSLIVNNKEARSQIIRRQKQQIIYLYNLTRNICITYQ